MGDATPIFLVTTFFASHSPERHAELTDCVRRNVASGIFERVILANEGLAAPFSTGDGRLHVLEIDTRPSFDDLLRIGAEHADAGSLLVVANTDIRFDTTLRALATRLTTTRCAALSRWQHFEDGRAPELLDHNDSQDAWAFRVPAPSIEAPFPPGVPRCDNRLLRLLQDAKMEVINPAFSVRTYHHHTDANPHYGEDRPEYIRGPYAYLWPHNLFGPVRTLALNAVNPGMRLGYRLDRRRFRRSTMGRALNRILKKNDAWWGFHAESQP